MVSAGPESWRRMAEGRDWSRADDEAARVEFTIGHAPSDPVAGTSVRMA
jgi:hypothetical protein